MKELKPLLAQLKANIVVRRLAGDGGPGSGNWGHRGRPGKVGGSGPGGGFQYRGGRSDIGYFSSKTDWLNGLTGEKQQTATRILKSAEKNIPEGSTQSPEEYVMKNMPMEVKKMLVDLAGEARSWSKKGMMLANALSADEEWGLWKLGEHLDKKYAEEGETIFTDEEIMNNNFDEKWGLMTPEEQEFYLDAKAKSCGLPTSGKELSEYSKPFQRELEFIKEATPPLSDEENKKWSEYMTRDEKEHLTNGLIDAFGPDKDFEVLSDMNAVEHTILEKMKDAAEDGKASEMIEAVSKYLKDKDELVNAKFFENLHKVPVFYAGGNEGVGRIDRINANALQDILTEWSKKNAPDKNLEDNGQEIEDGFLADGEVSEKLKGAYLVMKACALGTSEEGMSLFGNRQIVKSQAQIMRAERHKNEIKAERQAKLDEYNAQKNKWNVVIEGDSFSEEINSMRNESGSYTSEEYSKIGKRVASELKKFMDADKKEIEELDKKIEEIKAPQEEELKRIREAESHTLSEIFEVYDKYNKLTAPYANKKVEIKKRTPILEVLERVREVGPENPKSVEAHLPGRSTMKRFVADGYNVYPRAWVNMSLKQGTLETKKVKRGYYDDVNGVIAISGDYDEACRETVTHELGHRFEYTVPGIVEMEREFFERRTQGEEFEQLRKLTNNKSYKAEERAKKDKFVNPYIGRDNGGNAFEIVSMGFAYAFHNPEVLLGDADYANLILGILTVG